MLNDTRLPPRFWTKVALDPVTGCWRWMASLRKDGYGRFHWKTGPVLAHRLAYETLVQPVEAVLVIDHLCRNRACVNPAHLEPVTNKENSLRGVSPIAIAARSNTCLKGHALDQQGDRRRCLTCNRETRQLWRKENLEARLQAERAYRQRNRNHIREYARQWRRNRTDV